MAGRLIIPGICPTLDANGRVDPTASFQFYQNRTTTPQDIFTTPDLDVDLDNPLAPDSSGRLPEIWGPDGAVYTVEWTPTGESPITYNDIELFTGGYDVPVFLAGAIADGETYPIFMIVRNLRLPPDLVGSQFAVKGVAPTATATFTLQKNGSTIGTISFATDNTPTVVFTNAVDFVPGDAFSMDAPSPDDATLTDVSMTFVFQVQ